MSEDEFWYGRSFPLRCPNPDPTDIDCNNRLAGPGTWSTANRLFGVSDFNTTSIHTFVDIRFSSPPGQ